MIHKVWFNMINGKRLYVELNEQQLEQYMEHLDELKYAHVSDEETMYIIQQDEINYIEIMGEKDE